MTAPSLPADVPAPLTWADPARAEAFRRWIGRIAPAQRLRPETVRLASADASFRRYLRVTRTPPAWHAS